MFELKDMLESFTDFVYQPKLYRNQFVVHEEGRPHFPSLLNKKHGGHDSSSTSEGSLYCTLHFPSGLNKKHAGHDNSSTSEGRLNCTVHYHSGLNKKHGGHDSSSTSEGRLYFRI